MKAIFLLEGARALLDLLNMITMRLLACAKVERKVFHPLNLLQRLI